MSFVLLSATIPVMPPAISIAAPAETVTIGPVIEGFSSRTVIIPDAGVALEGSLRTKACFSLPPA